MHELPGDWGAADLRALLDMMEIEPGDTPEEDLGGLVEMALADHDAAESTGAALLAKGDPAFLLRVLAAGMEKSAPIRRIYGDSLPGGPFPEAASLLWRIRTEKDGADPAGRTFAAEIHSSRQWLCPLEDAETWEARVPVEIPWTPLLHPGEVIVDGGDGEFYSGDRAR